MGRMMTVFTWRKAKKDVNGGGPCILGYRNDTPTYVVWEEADSTFSVEGYGYFDSTHDTIQKAKEVVVIDVTEGRPWP